jgi:aminoglycoside phosphotransferase (APT) family kinase protein
MPIPEQRNLEEARGILGKWLAEQLPGATDVEIGPIGGPAATGFSNETLLFDATWNDDGRPRTEPLVVRVKPVAHTVFLEADFEYQYKVLSTLGARTDVPVPNMRWFEADDTWLGAPFFVMDHVNGRAPSDSPPYTHEGWLLSESTPEQRRTLVRSGLESMTKVHAVDWRALGLDFLDKPQYGRLGFEQQLRYYEASFDWAIGGNPPPDVGIAALDWVRAHAPDHDPEITLCWGDARINNQLFGADYRVAAVVDWEMVTLADPMMDLGWWLFLDRFFHEAQLATRMEGFPTREEMVSYYEQVSGRTARDLEFYEIFAGLRFTVVMMRLAELFFEFDLIDRAQSTETARNNPVTRATADLLGIAPPGEPTAGY